MAENKENFQIDFKVNAKDSKITKTMSNVHVNALNKLVFLLKIPEIGYKSFYRIGPIHIDHPVYTENCSISLPYL